MGILEIKGVNKLHHIHIWHLNDEELHLEAHLDCSEDIKMSEFNILLEKIETVDWAAGKIVSAEVFNQEKGYVAGPKSLSITGEGYDG